MKFGLMYEIQIPEPHYDGIERERYQQVMAQAALADEVGFEYFWTVEHHFLWEFSHCSAPEVEWHEDSHNFLYPMCLGCVRISVKPPATASAAWLTLRRSTLSRSDSRRLDRLRSAQLLDKRSLGA
jgi:hypothetical protein